MDCPTLHCASAARRMGTEKVGRKKDGLPMAMFVESETFKGFDKDDTQAPWQLIPQQQSREVKPVQGNDDLVVRVKSGPPEAHAPNVKPLVVGEATDEGSSYGLKIGR